MDNDREVEITIDYYTTYWPCPNANLPEDRFMLMSYGRWFLSEFIEQLIDDPFADPTQLLVSQSLLCFCYSRSDILSEAVETIMNDLQYLYEGGSLEIDEA